MRAAPHLEPQHASAAAAPAPLGDGPPSETPSPKPPTLPMALPLQSALGESNVAPANCPAPGGRRIMGHEAKLAPPSSDAESAESAGEVTSAASAWEREFLAAAPSPPPDCVSREAGISGGGMQASCGLHRPWQF